MPANSGSPPKSVHGDALPLSLSRRFLGTNVSSIPRYQGRGGSSTSPVARIGLGGQLWLGLGRVDSLGFGRFWLEPGTVGRTSTADGCTTPFQTTTRQRCRSVRPTNTRRTSTAHRYPTHIDSPSIPNHSLLWIPCGPMIYP